MNTKIPITVGNDASKTIGVAVVEEGKLRVRLDYENALTEDEIWNTFGGASIKVHSGMIDDSRKFRIIDFSIISFSLDPKQLELGKWAKEHGIPALQKAQEALAALPKEAMREPDVKEYD